MSFAAFDGTRRVPPAVNEPIRSYAPGSAEKKSLKARIARMESESVEIPIIIGGKRIHSGDIGHSVMPCDFKHEIATYHKATTTHVEQAIAAAATAHKEWASWRWEDRAAVFLRAAELLTTTWRDTVNAATMLGQAKTVFQSEIDGACELIDFWRFNAQFAQELYSEQPMSDHAAWNQLDYRPLEGFVYAVSPFNFTAIGGNLAGAPALMGNTVLWKPAATAMLSAYYIMQILEEAGLPPGVINFLPGDPVLISKSVLTHRELAGVHFTGSTGVFNSMWETIGRNMGGYKSYPRIVGETGGKDFIVAHASADPQAVAVGMVRGAFEYQGQKCSAASRAYIPRSMWPEVRDRCVAMMAEIKQGDVRDFRNFVAAVIDRKAYDRNLSYLELAKTSANIIAGGKGDDSKGYFIQPTLLEATDPASRLLCEEIFGPILSCHVYDDAKWEDTLRLVDATSPYALTGAVFARERSAIREASAILRQAAGNFYINDKPTGAVVGNQPFGGARGSGTNDKAGSKLNLMRWVSARTIKETLSSPLDYKYPFLGEE
ncbi:MAG: L-glutamate gamma-semialdehyde dehydrogenase [Gemmatimonadaceae bacterium]